MPVSASLTPWLDSRHFSYSSLNRTAAWLSVQPSRTELLMLADNVACRDAVSPASAWHCPAIVCNVAMSTLMTPPHPPGGSRWRSTVGAVERRPRAPCTTGPVVHRSAPPVPRPPHGLHDRRVQQPSPPGRGPRRAPRTWTLHGVEAVVDVEVCAPPGAVLGDVLPVLTAELGLPAGGLWSGTTELSADVPLTSPVLRHGAVLGLDRPGPRSATSSGALELHVAGGPDAGRALPLGRGDLVVGRGAGCGLALHDPDVSRRHVLLSVTEGQVTVADLGSSNGSVLDVGGRPAVPLGGAPVPVPVGAVVRLGASTLRLTGPHGAALESTGVPGGRLLVRPLRAASAAPPEVAVRFPAAPPEPHRRGL